MDRGEEQNGRGERLGEKKIGERSSKEKWTEEKSRMQELFCKERFEGRILALSISLGVT